MFYQLIRKNLKTGREEVLTRDYDLQMIQRAQSEYRKEENKEICIEQKEGKIPNGQRVVMAKEGQENQILETISVNKASEFCLGLKELGWSTVEIAECHIELKKQPQSQIIGMRSNGNDI